ncbi:SURF1 family protein [Spongiibacter taiwanensis]|uniref:SURF1 family protein n=1 Tax=Spongiibacter taiwanensis TaxID=1748242 RepID=UPI002034FF5C|nr:SURF1 family protein [Spongiibacter taiwanensis]USA41756.1 SURF1 family protein [Spongiibacter taiwanensis]
MSPHPTRFRWQLDWKSLLAIVLFLPILVGLGMWQLNRADEKSALLESYQQRQQMAPVALSTLSQYPNYQPVLAAGMFDPNRYWLLDNRIVQRQFGYQVIGLFQLRDGGAVLVDRGWIAGDPSRRQLPKVTFPATEVELRGQLYLGEDKPFSLGEMAQDQWPRLQQWLDVEALQQEMPALLPTVLQLNDQSPSALRIQRIVVNVSPEKHTGYAVQWFGMALVLAIIFLCRNSNILALLRRKTTSSDENS